MYKVFIHSRCCLPFTPLGCSQLYYYLCMSVTAFQSLIARNPKSISFFLVISQNLGHKHWDLLQFVCLFKTNETKLFDSIYCVFKWHFLLISFLNAYILQWIGNLSINNKGVHNCSGHSPWTQEEIACLTLFVWHSIPYEFDVFDIVIDICRFFRLRWGALTKHWLSFWLRMSLTSCLIQTMLLSPMGMLWLPFF